MITVSPALPHDAPAMAALLAEMDHFYGATGTKPADDQVRQIHDALFSSPPAAYALLARHGTAVAGIATYSFLWPAAGRTRSLYLKELYVARAYRRQGIGNLLMQALTELAGMHQCSRIEWTTDTGTGL